MFLGLASHKYFSPVPLYENPQKNHGQDKHEHTKHHQHAKSILQHDGDRVPQSPTKSTSSSWFKKQAVTSLSKVETFRKKIRKISKQFSIREIASKTNLNGNLSLPRPRQSRSGQNKYNKKRIKKSEMTTKTQTDKSYYTPPDSRCLLHALPIVLHFSHNSFSRGVWGVGLPASRDRGPTMNKVF